MKYFKKSAFILLFSAFLFGSFTVVSAEKLSLNEEKESKSPLNLMLDNLVVELNEQLENGEEEVNAIGYYEGNPIEVNLKIEDVEVLPHLSINGSSLASSNFRTKSFQVNLVNKAGANFEHYVYGDWTYNYKTTKIESVSPKSMQYGPLYSKTHKTGHTYKSDSVREVESLGTFKLLRYGLEKKTHIVIWVNGTGTYQIKTLAIL